jgi:hypothetical protein
MLVQLKSRVVGKQLAGARIFQIDIGMIGKRLSGQRGLAHLARAKDDHGGKPGGKGTQAISGEARVHGVTGSNLCLHSPTKQLKIQP